MIIAKTTEWLSNFAERSVPVSLGAGGGPSFETGQDCRPMKAGHVPRSTTRRNTSYIFHWETGEQNERRLRFPQILAHPLNKTAPRNSTGKLGSKTKQGRGFHKYWHTSMASNMDDIHRFFNITAILLLCV